MLGLYVLFVLFFNDLPNVISVRSGAALYADETKIYKKISCEDDAKHLQETPTNFAMLQHQHYIQ